MEKLRDSMRSLLDAQERRFNAYKRGYYELRDNEGFQCLDCGWRDLSAPMVNDPTISEDGNTLVECRECGSTSLNEERLSDQDMIEIFQSFGYEYSAFPEDIPNGEDEEYLLE